MKEKIAGISVFVNLILAVGKIIVGTISKSAAVLADGINSGTDVIASIISYIGIRTAEKPADTKHPYGHGKAEVISGFLITVIIFLSGLWIIVEAVKKFFNPSSLEISYLPFVVMGGSAFINGIMSYVKVHYGKKYDSVSLISDGIHSKIDLLVSLVIFISLFFVKFYTHMDSILALLVGVYILKEAFILGRETSDSLLGSSAGEEIEKKIKGIVKKENIKLEKLKTQKLGNKVFAELNINLPSKLKVEEAESVTKNLEEKLTKDIEQLEYISIQIKSHDVKTGFYKPSLGLGKGFGWERRGRMKGKIRGARAFGLGGDCVCSSPKCDYKVKHTRGKPCSSLKCKKCGSRLMRENA